MPPLGHPLGGKTTSTYEAQKALLDFELGQRRQEILRMLGQTSPQGQFVMGDVEREAGRSISDLERQRRLTIEDVTNAMREGGTLFSGIRARTQSRAEHPFITAMGRTREDTARTLGNLYTSLGDLERERSVRMGMILAEAARERANMLRQMNFG